MASKKAKSGLKIVQPKTSAKAKAPAKKAAPKKAIVASAIKKPTPVKKTPPPKPQPAPQNEKPAAPLKPHPFAHFMQQHKGAQRTAMHSHKSFAQPAFRKKAI